MQRPLADEFDQLGEGLALRQPQRRRDAFFARPEQIVQAAKTRRRVLDLLVEQSGGAFALSDDVVERRRFLVPVEFLLDGQQLSHRFHLLHPCP